MKKNKKIQKDHMDVMVSGLRDAITNSFLNSLEYAAESGGWLEETMSEVIQEIAEKSLLGQVKEQMIEQVKRTMLKDPEFIANLTAKAILKATK